MPQRAQETRTASDFSAIPQIFHDVPRLYFLPAVFLPQKEASLEFKATLESLCLFKLTTFHCTKNKSKCTEAAKAIYQAK